MSEAVSAGSSRRVDVIATTGDVASDAQALDRALAAYADRDLVVLAPDARVHGDWLDRLAVHANVASTGIVGTFTNVDGSAIYARGTAAARLPDGESAASLDDHFRAANAGRSAEVAVVHGPCRYFTRACLRVLGVRGAELLDDARAAEVSQRAVDLGFRVAVAGDVFVAREQNAAFAPGDDTSAVDDPSGALRALERRVDLARLARAPQPVIAFVSHGWGGGVRRHMDDLATLVRHRALVLHLEPGGRDHVKLAWRREGEAFAARFRLPDEFAALVATMRAIGVHRVHFHHVHGLPRAILELPAALGVPYDCTLHDYYPICPQYHLADEQGRYCGEPDAAGCARCLAGRPAQWGIDIATWRDAFATFLAQAARVIAPSEDVANRVHRYLPALAISLWPHPESPPAWPATVARIVTLGSLSPEKGLDVVAACALDARQRSLPLAFRVLGATARPLPQWPDAPLSVHGSYDEDVLVELLASEHPSVLFFPAQVPETWSYTLSVALASGLPIVASALGVFPERLAGRANARLLPFDASASDWNAALLAASREPRIVDDPSTRRPTLRAAS
jgi:glycosyltransferase involved in cell wall biosynthesis